MMVVGETVRFRICSMQEESLIAMFFKKIDNGFFRASELPDPEI